MLRNTSTGPSTERWETPVQGPAQNVEKHQYRAQHRTLRNTSTGPSTECWETPVQGPAQNVEKHQYRAQHRTLRNTSTGLSTEPWQTSTGPSTEPWETPKSSDVSVDFWLSMTVWGCIISCRKDEIETNSGLYHEYIFGESHVWDKRRISWPIVKLKWNKC